MPRRRRKAPITRVAIDVVELLDGGMRERRMSSCTRLGSRKRSPRFGGAQAPRLREYGLLLFARSPPSPSRSCTISAPRRPLPRVPPRAPCEAPTARGARVVDTAYRAGTTTNLDVTDADTAAVVADDAVRQARLDLLAATGHFP